MMAWAACIMAIIHPKITPLTRLNLAYKFLH
jgi:hypothetical protein